MQSWQRDHSVGHNPEAVGRSNARLTSTALQLLFLCLLLALCSSCILTWTAHPSSSPKSRLQGGVLQEGFPDPPLSPAASVCSQISALRL